MSTCTHCGGTMIGDGYTTPVTCENFDPDSDIGVIEPDSGPWYCSHNPKCDGCGNRSGYSEMTQVVHREPDGTPDIYYLCRNCIGADPKET
jgi:hypothetical protein